MNSDLKAVTLLTFKKLFLSFICLFLISNLGMSQDLLLNEVMSSNSTILSPVTEDSYDWVELYNNSNNVLSLDGYSLSDDIENPSMWTFPADIEIPANSYYIVWLSGETTLTSEGEVHASFRINSQGESIYLYDSQTELIDNSPSINIQPDLTIGRIVGNNAWFYLDAPSLSSENLAQNAFSEQAQPPTPSQNGGLYITPITLTFDTDATEDIIRYTTDFSEPTEESEAITGNLFIYENTTLKLKTFRENALQSTIISLSYLFSDNLSLDVISITTPTENLFGTNGIYDNESSGEEIEASLEMFENGQTVISQNIGLKIHSPDSRDQLGFRIYARSEYGENRINHPLFSQKDLSSFKTLILRNGGNDGAELDETHFRDALGHELYLELNPENGMACYKPVNVFLNGEYWGIYNLRERQDEHYLKDNYDVTPASVDFLEYDYNEPDIMKIISGNWNNWGELQTFVLENDLSTPENYQAIDDWVDLDNFIDYQLFEIAIGNQDWCNNNIKFWRPVDGGKWKWILWDIEYGFGTFGNAPVGSPEFNFFEMALTWGGWSDGDYTWLFRELLNNLEFRDRFITRTQDLLNTSFRPSHLEENITAKKERIEEAMPAQLDKWGGTLEQWEASIEEFLFYTDQRGYYLLENIADWFDFEATTYEIEIDISQLDAGSIELNTITLNLETIGAEENTFPWNGQYYGTQQLNLVAQENPGYTFSNWEGDIFSEDAAITVYLVDDLSITAVYDYTGTDPIPDYSALVINEIMSSNQTVYEDEFGEFEDWIELYNSGNEPIDLSGLYLSDNANDLLKFQIPNSNPEMILAPNEHIVFYADDNAEQGDFHTNFKLDNNGEEVLLSYLDFSLEAVNIDQIEFDAIPPNSSYGRISDAQEEWINFDISTPNATNEILINVDSEASEALNILVYPNPSRENINFSIEGLNRSKISQIRFLSTEGKESLSLENPNQLTGIDISHLPSGVYFIEFTLNETDSKSRVKFIKL